MDARKVTSAADARKIVEEKGLTHVKVGIFDMDGIMRGKFMAREKFVSALDKGFGFCDVVLGWDSYDQLYDNVDYTGWHTGFPDAPVRILPDSCRELPLEEDSLLFVGEFADGAEAICPRGVLRRVIAKAENMGYRVKAGLEYEFFVFDETAKSIRDKRYRDLSPMAPGFFGYSVLRNSAYSDFYQGLLKLGEKMDFPIEGLHEETGPGVMEAALQVTDAIEAADRAALFKTFAKIYAQKHDRIATFMAKWSPDWPGQSGHIHISLTDKKGKSAFHDSAAPDGMSRTMRQFVAGQQDLMPEFLAMVAPTVNSYRRLIPGFWAPTDSTWGIDNRTGALRVIPGSTKSQRVEYRVAAADANPYLALAAAIASGLYGIENGLEPPQPIRGNAYDQKFPQRWRLPATLWDAAQRFKKSKAARALFDDAFVDHFAASREWEEREFRKHISDWEMERYFEVI
ncbi:MAG: glutamine synthetase [Alphaproteobacteria bacterium]|nr:glutamine synthetase [Alphaproteobacteria bacterium]